MSNSSRIKSIGVFCGARPEIDQKYRDLAVECGKRIAKENLKLIYGGGDSGLMGEVSAAAKKEGSNVLGISTELVSAIEISHEGSDHTYITKDMFERKKDLFTNSDAYICLPGGFGTLDEIFEILTLKYLKDNEKEIVILNFENYWDPLLKLIDHVIEHKFAPKQYINNFKVANNVDEAFEALGF